MALPFGVLTTPVCSMFPFVPEAQFEEIGDKMSMALKDFGPIRITLSHFSHFSHGKTSKTLFCEVDDEAKAVLKKLYVASSPWRSNC